jgi:transcription elongation GreA/GreB family factor
MTSRLVPPAITAEVRSELAAELATLQDTKRRRGQAGLHHDRTRTYLTIMLERTGTCDPALTGPALPGDLVSVRFDGDAEHRTYLLAGGDNPAAATALPLDWPLGTALLGSHSGQRLSYTPTGSDREHTVHVIAVWGHSTDSWQLPQHAAGDA